MAKQILKNNIQSEFSISHTDDRGPKEVTSDSIVVSVDTTTAMEAIVSPKDGDTVIVKDLNRGGTFIYDATQSAVNNSGTVFNGWVRQYSGAVYAKWFGTLTTSIVQTLTTFKEVIGHTESVIIDTQIVFNNECDFNMNGLTFTLGNNVDTHMISIPSTTSYVKIYGGTIDGNRTNQTALSISKGIFARGDNLTVKDMIIRNFNNSAVNTMDSSYVTLDDIIVLNCGGIVIYVGSNNNDIRDIFINKINMTLSDPLDIGVAVKVNPDPQYRAYTVRITNSKVVRSYVIDNISYVGFETKLCTNVTVDKLISVNNSIGVSISEDTIRASVTGCVITMSEYGPGSGIEIGAGKAGTATDTTTVTGNVIEGHNSTTWAGSGILFNGDGNNYLAVSGNTIKYCEKGYHFVGTNGDRMSHISVSGGFVSATTMFEIKESDYINISNIQGIYDRLIATLDHSSNVSISNINTKKKDATVRYSMITLYANTAYVFHDIHLNGIWFDTSGSDGNTNGQSVLNASLSGGATLGSATVDANITSVNNSRGWEIQKVPNEATVLTTALIHHKHSIQPPNDSTSYDNYMPGSLIVRPDGGYDEGIWIYDKGQLSKSWRKL